MSDTTGWRTVAEQAEIWRCSTTAVLSAINRKDLPATLIGGRYLIDPDDAAKYEVEKRTVRRSAPRVRRPKRRAS